MIRPVFEPIKPFCREKASKTMICLHNGRARRWNQRQSRRCQGKERPVVPLLAAIIAQDAGVGVRRDSDG